MSLRAKYCIVPHSLNKWLYDLVSVEDLFSKEAIKTPFEEIDVIEDLLSKYYYKIIGKSHSGFGNAPFNTLEYNSNYMIPGSERITLTDRAIILHDKHGYFFTGSISLADSSSINVSGKNPDDEAYISDHVEISQTVVSRSDLSLVEDEVDSEFVKVVNDIYHLDAMGSYAFNTHEYNTNYSVTAGVNGVSFKEVFELTVH